MKLPVIRHLQKNNQKEQLLHTAEVLESLCEHRSVKEEEMDMIGELLTNIYGAVEVHTLVENEGMSQIDAANAFVKKVMGSIDR